MLLMRKFVSNARSVAGLFVPAALLLAMASAGEGRALGINPAPAQPEPISPLEVRYTLDTPGGGEIFPALASSAPARVLAGSHAYHGEYLVPTARGDGFGGDP